MKSGRSDITPDNPNARQRNIKAETAAASRSASPRQQKPPKKITETYLHNAGLYYLQRFAASTGHFRTVMQRKIDRSCRHHADQDRGECTAMLNCLIEKFTASGLLNDNIYSRGMVTSLKRRGFSERAIHARLQVKGLTQSEIQAALAGFHEDHTKDPDQTEFEAALKLARKKKLGPYAAGRETDLKKAMALFARAGFSFDMARRVLGLDIDSAENL